METRKLSAEEMMKDMTYKGGRTFQSGIIEQTLFEPLSEDYSYKSMLITDRVYKGYKQACANDQDVREGWWTETDKSIIDLDCRVWQADFPWAE